MLRQQQWIPDTHDAVLTLEWDDDAAEPAHTCVAATVGGEDAVDPQLAYTTILAENRLKNEALALICEVLPGTMKRALLDSDGDPTGELVIKDKFQPVWDFGAIDGRIAFTIPGASAPVLASVAVALAARFGDAVTVG